MNSVRMRGAKAAVAVMVMLAAPAIVEAQTRVKPGFNMFSAQQDAEIGRQSAAKIEQQVPILNNRAANELVNSIGQELVRYAGGPGFTYRFRVVNASDLNAFALPGGYVYINRGILESAQSEGEIAGVLAHEIAHVALRHGTHNASKASLTQQGAGLLAGLLGGRVGANAAQVINVVGGFGLNAAFLKYSREAETQADILATQMLARTPRYTAGDQISFFKTLSRVDNRRTINWLSSHPSPTNRISRIESEARSIGSSVSPSNRSTSRFQTAQASLRRLSPAPTTEQIARGYRR